LSEFTIIAFMMDEEAFSPFPGSGLFFPDFSYFPRTNVIQTLSCYCFCCGRAFDVFASLPRD